MSALLTGGCLLAPNSVWQGRLSSVLNWNNFLVYTVVLSVRIDKVMPLQITPRSQRPQTPKVYFIFTVSIVRCWADLHILTSRPCLRNLYQLKGCWCDRRSQRTNGDAHTNSSVLLPRNTHVFDSYFNVQIQSHWCGFPHTWHCHHKQGRGTRTSGEQSPV